jgi:polar amino acid transport system substrate-binding protein
MEGLEKAQRVTRRHLMHTAAAVAGAAATARLGGALAFPQAARAQQITLESGTRLAHPGGDGSFKKVVDKGIVFGITNDAPYNWRDPATSERRGIDYDITMAAAGRLGITKISFAEGPWASMVPGLISKRFDYLITNIHLTPKRLEVIDFTSPAYFYADWLIVQKGNPKGLTAWQGLKGHTVGAIRGENYVDWLDNRKDLAGVKVYKDFDEEIQDLSAGRVDAIIGDEPVYAWYLKAHPEARIELAKEYVPQSDLSDWTRFGVRKEDNDLNNAFTQALGTLKADGTLLAILERYGMSIRALATFPQPKK